MGTTHTSDARVAEKLAADHDDDDDHDASTARSMSESLHEASVERGFIERALKEAIKNPADLRTALSTLDKMWNHMVDAIEANGWTVNGTHVSD